MGFFDGFGIFEIGDGAGDFDGFEIAEGGEIEFVGGGFEKRFSVFFESDKFGDFEARKGTIEGGLVLVASVLVLYSLCYSIFYNIMFGGFERFDGTREFGIFDFVDGNVHIDTI